MRADLRGRLQNAARIHATPPPLLHHTQCWCTMSAVRLPLGVPTGSINHVNVTGWLSHRDTHWGPRVLWGELLRQQQLQDEVSPAFMSQGTFTLLSGTAALR